MRKASRFGHYVCPHGRSDALCSDGEKEHAIRGAKRYSVNGRYCRNNCGRYLVDCKLFGGVVK